tara:strand:- start:9485 stop:10420 length:936 start_codon:yes stop_codon:yes gene_type:complete
MAEEFVSQGQVTGVTPAEVVINYIKVETISSQAKFVFDGYLNGRQPNMTVQRGSTYYFDQSDSTNGGNTLALFTAADGTGPYTTNVTAGTIVEWVVAADAPSTLYYSKAGVTSALQGGTISCVDAPPSYAGDAGKSYTVTIDCSGNVANNDGTICPESLATAQASVTINDAAGYGRLEKGNMRWGAILEVLSERENPNSVTWAGVDANNVRDGGNTGNFTAIQFTVNYPTNWTPTTYLDASGAVTTTLVNSPDTAIKRILASPLSNILTHNRSLGSVDPTGDDQKDHDGVIAPAMFASFGAAVGKVTVTSL